MVFLVYVSWKTPQISAQNPSKLIPRRRGQSWTPRGRSGNGEERHRSELRPNPFGTFFNVFLGIGDYYNNFNNNSIFLTIIPSFNHQITIVPSYAHGIPVIESPLSHHIPMILPV